MRAISILAVLIVMSVVICDAGFAQKVVDWRETVKRGDRIYEVNSKEPFTGKMVLYWPENGNKIMEAEYRYGKKHGKSIIWYENSQKKQELEWRDGKQHGKGTMWYENGQKQQEVEFHDGTVISEKCWDENGNPIPCE